jgi:hypothetical protein
LPDFLQTLGGEAWEALFSELGDFPSSSLRVLGLLLSLTLVHGTNCPALWRTKNLKIGKKSKGTTHQKKILTVSGAEFPCFGRLVISLMRTFPLFRAGK